MPSPSTSPSAPTSTPTADITDTASHSDKERTTPPSPSPAAKQPISSPHPPARTCFNSAEDDVHLQSQTTGVEARRTDIHEWLDAITARQARELGDMRAAVDAVKAELEAVQARALQAVQAEREAAQAERESDRRLITALYHRVVVLETERNGVAYLDVAAVFRLRMRAAASSAVRPTRPA